MEKLIQTQEHEKNTSMNPNPKKFQMWGKKVCNLLIVFINNRTLKNGIKKAKNTKTQ